MAQKKVSELNTTSNVGLSDLFLLTQNLGQSQFDSLAITASDLATWLANSMSFPLLMPYTTATTLIGAINEIAQSGGGGGGGGSTVYLDTSAPSSATGSNADLYVQYTAGSPAVVDALYVKISGTWTEIDTGASTLSALSDTSLSSPSNGQVLKYNSTSGKWENANESGGGVSVFVIAKTGTNTYDKTFAEIKTAIDNGDLLFYSFNDYVYSATYLHKTSNAYTVQFQYSATPTQSSSDVALYSYVLTMNLSNQTFSITHWYADCVVQRELSGTLLAGSTTLTLTDSTATVGLHTDALLDFYTDIYGVSPTSASVGMDSDGFYYVAMTFEAQSIDMEVKVRVLG